MKLELVRWLLFYREQSDAFEFGRSERGSLSREEWLRTILSEKIEFIHMGSKFYFVPGGSFNGTIVVGRIGRKIIVKENEPPDQELRDTARDQWQAVDVIIDPTHHSDGQKIAVECNQKVGAPVSLLDSLANHINNIVEPPHPYRIDTNPILDPNDFMDFVRANKGEITSVTFELIAPNMFGIRDALDREMDELKRNEKAQKAKITLENQDGLNLDTERVENTANHAAEGGGMIKARTKRGHAFNSKKKGKKVIIPDDEVNGVSRESAWRNIINRVFGAREKI